MKHSCRICSGPVQLSFNNEIYDDRYGYPRKYSLLKCESCGHAYLSPKLTSSDISTLYTRFYPRSQMPKEMNVKAIFVSRKEIFLKGKKTACHYSVKPKSRCLDIGCGLGESLYYLKQNNCEAYGVEADENVLKMAEKYDLNIKIGLFDPKDYEKEYFDYVTMSQVLEHMVYPVEILNGVHDILKPNGRLIFSVPNSQSLLSTLLRKKWINWHIPYHQQHFTKRSIIKLAERCDFEIESIELVTPTPWLTYQINHLISYPELGKTSVFWSATEEKPLFLKAMFLFTSYIDQFNIMMPVARFLDFLSIGESYVVTFKKL